MGENVSMSSKFWTEVLTCIVKYVSDTKREDNSERDPSRV